LEFWDWHYKDGQIKREGPYRGWTDEDDFAFVDALLKAVEDAKLIKTGTGIVIEYFFELTEDERRWLTTSALYGKDWGQRGKPNDPWFAAFQSTILAAGALVPIGEKLYPVFDIRNSPSRKKKPEQDKAREIYAEILNQSPSVKVRDRLGESLVFGTREQHLGLQAADLLANRSRVYVVDGLGDDKLSNRIGKFLETGSGYTKMLNLRGLDLLLRGCPFRTTFWRIEDFKTAEPDYLERMRGAGLGVVAYKGARTGEYYAHHIKPTRIQKLKRLGVYGDLVYIESPDSSTESTTNPKSDKEK